MDKIQQEERDLEAAELFIENNVFRVCLIGSCHLSKDIREAIHVVQRERVLHTEGPARAKALREEQSRCVQETRGLE